MKTVWAPQLLSREQLERLVEAHRKEYVDGFCEHISDDEEQCECLADFEEEHIEPAAEEAGKPPIGAESSGPR